MYSSFDGVPVDGGGAIRDVERGIRRLSDIYREFLSIRAILRISSAITAMGVDLLERKQSIYMARNKYNIDQTCNTDNICSYFYYSFLNDK